MPFKYLISIMTLFTIILACGKQSDNVKYEVLNQEVSDNQLLVDIFLPNFNVSDGEKVFDDIVKDNKSKNYGGLHVSFWNKKFTEKEMKDYYNSEFSLPKGTKTFLCNYGYKKGFREVQKIVEIN